MIESKSNKELWKIIRYWTIILIVIMWLNHLCQIYRYMGYNWILTPIAWTLILYFSIKFVYTLIITYAERSKT